jgi:hypothetical protein
MGKACGVHEQWNRNVYRFLFVAKPDGKSPLLRPRPRRELKETGCDDMEWVYLALYRDN